MSVIASEQERDMRLRGHRSAGLDLCDQSSPKPLPSLAVCRQEPVSADDCCDILQHQVSAAAVELAVLAVEDGYADAAEASPAIASVVSLGLALLVPAAR